MLDDVDAVVVGTLEIGGGPAESEDAEDGVHDVVVSALVAEEHVVDLMVFLQRRVGYGEGLFEIWGWREAAEAEMVGGEADERRRGCGGRLRHGEMLMIER